MEGQSRVIHDDTLDGTDTCDVASSNSESSREAGAMNAGSIDLNDDAATFPSDTASVVEDQGFGEETITPIDTENSNSVDINQHESEFVSNVSESTNTNKVGKQQVSNSSKSAIKKQTGSAEETEVVSEDELPAVEKPKIKDAENVSDDELPGPNPAELPADTEVVSEDELPTVKKDGKDSRKRKNESDKEDGDTPESESKKKALVKNGESKPTSTEKRTLTEESPKPKSLPELDKYWKVVNDDPTDFTGWTYLLQYVDQESDVEAAREAYDAFLSHYPYCYGYWRKYSDYEKRKGSKKKCNEVLERGLKAIPLSVDLWIHYINHIKTTRPDEHDLIRNQYERAIDACGLEFRSDRLWESYAKWESENGIPVNVTKIYDRLLSTPTMGYAQHFENFQEHIMSTNVANAVDPTQFVRYRTEVRDGREAQLDLPPGEDEPDDHVADEEEAKAIKERILAARKKMHKATAEQVAARWSFEEGIKRPYFHVKPLERCQLKNWKAYLEWEKQNGSFKRAYILHERCLIACALYEEFWLKLVKFLEERLETDPSLVPLQRDVLERACTVHHVRRPALHLCWAYFEEAQGFDARAVEILDRIEKVCPNLLEIQYRRINLERRRGDHEKVIQLYEQYIAAAKSKVISSALAVKYARFLNHVKHNTEAATKVLDDAIVKDPLNPRLHLQRLDLVLHIKDVPYHLIEENTMSYEKQEGADLEISTQFAWRRRELAEEFGTIAEARQAYAHYLALAKNLRKRTRKHDGLSQISNAEASKRKELQNSANNYYQAAAVDQSYGQNYAQQSYGNSWNYQQQAAYQQQPTQHSHPWSQYQQHAYY